MALELAKILKLVAPISMTQEAHLSWLASAVDALEGIRVAEVKAISVEVRRSITRPSQIVPEIARLVDEKRKRGNRSSSPSNPFAAEMAIGRESNERRTKAHGSAVKLEEAFEWERQARINAGLNVRPREPAFSRDELDHMPSHIVRMGLNSGFLKRENGRLVEVQSPDETDRIREETRRNQQAGR